MTIKRKLFCPYCNNFRVYTLPLKQHIHNKEVVEISCFYCKKMFKVQRNFIKIYLSRSFFASDLKYKYPIFIQKKYEGLFLLINPLSILSATAKIDNIINSDIMIVCMQSLQSTDPFFELMYAKMMRIPCLVIDPNRQFTLDTWVQYCADRTFDVVDDCFNYILPRISVK